MMSKAPSISFIFSITGNIADIESVEKAIAIKPTEIWRKKNSSVDFSDVPPISWNFGLENVESYSISDVAVRVLNSLWDNKDLIINYLKNHDNLKASFSCNVRITEDRPEYSLSSDIMSRMAFFDAEFCLDIFDCSED